MTADGTMFRGQKCPTEQQVDGSAGARQTALMTGQDAPCVGRTEELERLMKGIQGARDGAGGLVLVAGESGIGKSRLAEELAQRAEAAGVRPVWGRCWEAGDAPAYWPWVQVLRAMRDEDPTSPWWIDHHQNLAMLFPERSGSPSAPGLAAEQARFVLLEQIATAICAASRLRPRLVVLEDLHLADEASLSALDLMSLRAKSQPLLIVGTFRDAAIYPGYDCLSRLAQRERSLSLVRLTANEVAGYLAAAIGMDNETDAERVHQISEGNPLVMVELIRLLRSQGQAALDMSNAAIDRGLKRVFAERLLLLSLPTRRFLEALSVWGRETTLDRLLATLDDDIGLDAAIEEALDAGVVCEGASRRLRFVHILYRERVDRGLARARRSELHRRAAVALERGPERTLAELGHHWREAGPDGRARALEVTQQEAVEAMAVYAYDRAAVRYRDALDLHAALHPSDEVGRARLLVALGGAELHAGEAERGHDHCRDAASIFHRIGDAEGLASAALEYGTIMRFAEVDPELVRLLEQAQAAFGDVATPLRARVLARLAAAMQPSADASTAVALARRAIAMARGLGDLRLLLEVLRTATAAMIDLVDSRVCRELNREHAGLAERLGETEHALRAHLRWAFDEYYLGDLAEARALLAKAADCAGRLRHPLFSWYTPAFVALTALHQGDAVSAAAAIAEVERIDRGHPYANRRVVLLCHKIRLARLEGDDEAQHRLLDGLLTHFSASPIGRTLGRTIVAADLLYDGRPARDEDLLSEAEVEVILGSGDHTSFPLLAEIAARRHDAALARRLEQQLLSLGHLHASLGVMTLVWDGPLALALGRVAETYGDRQEAARRWAEGFALARATGAEPAAGRLVLAWMQMFARASEGLDPEPLRHAVAEIATLRVEPNVARRVRALAEVAWPAATVVPSEATATHEVTTPPDVAFSLLRVGEQWQLVVGPSKHLLRDSKGIGWLAALLAEPGRAFHVLTLSAPAFDPRADREGLLLLDDEARAAYRRRLEVLDGERAEAETFQDLARLERLDGERETLLAELRVGLGLCGRDRRSPNATERARVNVQRRLKDAISRLGQLEPRVGDHLRRAVRTGVLCVYDPDVSRARAQ